MLFEKRPRLIKRLLIVEDEPLVAFDNEHLLGEAGYVVVATVDSVQAALAMLASEPIDLVLADVRLRDGGNGVAVARAAGDRGVAVLFVSAYCPVQAHPYALGCLAKPYRPRDLLRAVTLIETVKAGGDVARLPRGLRLYG